MGNTRKALGTALEKRVVEKAREAGLSSTKQPLSGVLKDFPSDVVIEDVLVECKVRTAEFIPPASRYVRMDFNWLEKVREEAKGAGFREGAVVINPKYSKYPSVLISLDFFLELLVDSKPETVEKSEPITLERMLGVMTGKIPTNHTLLTPEESRLVEKSLRKLVPMVEKT